MSVSPKMFGVLAFAFLLACPMHASDLDLSATKASLSNKRWKSMRGLVEYINFLVGDEEELLSLSAKDHVLDLGGGHGIFSRQLAGMIPENEYRKFNFREVENIPRVTVVTYEKINLGTVTNNYRPLTGRLFEEIPDEELLGFGNITHVYDFWGVLAYTLHPVEVLAKLYSIMAHGGTCLMKAGVRDFISVSLLSGITTMRSSVHFSSVLDGFSKKSLVDWIKDNVKGFHIELVNDDTNRAALKLIKDENIPFSAPKLIFQKFRSEYVEPRGRIFSEES